MHQAPRSEVDQYNAQWLWKRIGAAFWVPIYGQYHVHTQKNTVGNDITVDYSREIPAADRAINANCYTIVEDMNTGALYQNFSQTAVALTYDIDDLATLSLGLNLDRKVFYCISLDVSSPISEFTNSLRTDLRSMKNLASTPSGL